MQKRCIEAKNAAPARGILAKTAQNNKSPEFLFPKQLVIELKALF